MLGFGSKGEKPLPTRKIAESRRKENNPFRINRKAGVQAKQKEYDYIGFKYADAESAPNQAEKDRAYGISSEERVHMAIFGSPGYGKSSILKLLIYQNIKKKNGIMIIDPHGELARDVMSMIPPEMHEDVIYVNPASLYRFGKTIQINPLEAKSDVERPLVVMNFVAALYNLYKDAWGPRLEVVLRNAANALIESEDSNTISSISDLITNEDRRREILEGVASKNVKHFWEEIFAKQYSKDAGSSAYNKIDKILSTPTVAAMFDSPKSSISIDTIINTKKMLIVDLSTGASDDIAEFLGSIFLNMLYVDAKKRLDIEGRESVDNTPFYVYVDEAHMFSNSTMSEMLRSLRKFNVKMTLATQTANAYEKTFGEEIPGICKTIVTSRCDQHTSRLLRAVMNISPDEMQRLPKHTFAVFSDESGKPANAILRSRPVPLPGTKLYPWTDVAKTSTEKWGREINVENYIPTVRFRNMMFKPIDASIIHMMYFDERDWYREEIMNRVGIIFPKIKEKYIMMSIDKLVRDKYIRVMYPKSDDGDRNDSTKRYVLTERTYNTYLSKSYGGRAAGSEGHMETILGIMFENMNKHRYCIPDRGDKSGESTDLLILEPAINTAEDGYTTFDPHRWNENNVLAVEVETEPIKHIKQTVFNYTKNVDKGYQVWMVCFNERGVKAAEEAIRKERPDFKNIRLDIIDYPELFKKHGKNWTQYIPDTYDEVLTKVKVRDMRHIVVQTKSEREARGSTAGGGISHHSMGTHVKTQKEKNPDAIPGQLPPVRPQSTTPQGPPKPHLTRNDRLMPGKVEPQDVPLVLTTLPENGPPKKIDPPTESKNTEPRQEHSSESDTPHETSANKESVRETPPSPEPTETHKQDTAKPEPIQEIPPKEPTETHKQDTVNPEHVQETPHNDNSSESNVPHETPTSPEPTQETSEQDTENPESMKTPPQESTETHKQDTSKPEPTETHGQDTTNPEPVQQTKSQDVPSTPQAPPENTPSTDPDKTTSGPNLEDRILELVKPDYGFILDYNLMRKKLNDEFEFADVKNTARKMIKKGTIKIVKRELKTHAGNHIITTIIHGDYLKGIDVENNFQSFTTRQMQMMILDGAFEKYHDDMKRLLE